MEPKRRIQNWHHMLAMYAVMAILSGGLAYLFLHVNFIPHPASAERDMLDRFIQFLFAIAGIFFGIIVTVLAYSLIFFRRQKGDTGDARPIRGNTALELTWTLIPLFIVIGLSIYGSVILDRMTSTTPTQKTVQSLFSLGAFIPSYAPVSPNATQPELVVNVIASRYAWEFDYPDYGIKSFILEVPVDRRIRFDMTSKDVIHSFWVQEWGPKQDAVPGLSPSLLITPTEIGQFLVQCSQLCGYGHSDMTAPVRVVSGADFDQWVKQQQSANTTAPAAGAHVMVDLAAQNIAFDKSTITVPAGTEVMVDFDNKDSMPHNFSVYTDGSATKSIFIGQIITGPKTITYTFTAPAAPGTYFFRCDVHPTTMTGTFIVQ